MASGRRGTSAGRWLTRAGFAASSAGSRASTSEPASPRNWTQPVPWPPPPVDPGPAVRDLPGKVLTSREVKAKVLIRPKEGILDPQGKAVERALPALGFDGVSHVRVGRLVELEAENAGELDSLCEKLLANPLIEDY